MTVKIIFKGFAKETPGPEAVALLSRVLNGDKNMAQEALITPNFVLRSVSSMAEVDLVLPRLQKMGLVCEVVEASAGTGSAFKNHEITADLVTCKFCGYEQARTRACKKCGKAFDAVRKIDWKPPVEVERKNPADEHWEDDTSAFMNWIHTSPLFATKNLVIVGIVIFIALSMMGISLFGSKEGEGQQHADNSASQNPIVMLMGGIIKSDPKEVSKTMTYDPESGENPYAKRLESLGIDKKEFSKNAAGIEDGEISVEEVQGIIDSNPLLKQGIEDAINQSAQKSTGDTELDKKIEEIR